MGVPSDVLVVVVEREEAILSPVACLLAWLVSYPFTCKSSFFLCRNVS